MKKLLSIAVLGLLAGGCGPSYDRTEFTGQVAGGLGGEVTRERIVVPSGTLVKVHIVSKNDDNESMSNQIRSKDPSILDAIQVVSDRDYAFLGVRPGKTQVEIKADDQVVLVIDALVTEQSPP